MRPWPSLSRGFRAAGAAALVLLICLGGCVTLSQPAPPVRDYRLDYPPPAFSEAPLDVTIRVSRFSVASIYDRQAIAYRDGTYGAGTYLYDRWATNPGSMVADLIARDLASSDVYRDVQQSASVMRSDFQLTGHIESIEERPAADTCAAALRFRILLLRTRSTGEPVILRATYAESETCACHDASALAAAMSRVLERISVKLQRDVYAAIAEDRAPGGSSRRHAHPVVTHAPPACNSSARTDKSPHTATVLSSVLLRSSAL